MHGDNSASFETVTDPISSTSATERAAATGSG
jgi:hypothetical protein